MFVEKKKIGNNNGSLIVSLKPNGNDKFPLKKGEIVKVEYYNNKIVIKKADIKKDGVTNE